MTQTPLLTQLDAIQSQEFDIINTLRFSEESPAIQDRTGLVIQRVLPVDNGECTGTNTGRCSIFAKQPITEMQWQDFATWVAPFLDTDSVRAMEINHANIFSSFLVTINQLGRVDFEQLTMPSLAMAQNHTDIPPDVA